VVHQPARSSSDKEETMARAKPGDKVKVHYVGRLEGGTTFSSTYQEDEPFEFTIGQENVLKSFADAVVGMSEGETKTISVPPEAGYGQHKKEFVFRTERAQFPADLELKLGKRLQISSGEGKTVIATIEAITDDSVILDANDPLAGKTLEFEIELIRIL
jgi:FKBP-type peptidyl-prolyl cis-trans isomerase 2